MKHVVRALGTAFVTVALGAASLAAQAALVQFRIQGVVTHSWPFEDGSTLPEGTPVAVTYTYDHVQAPLALEQPGNGVGSAVYGVGAPYHFRVFAGNHRIRAAGYRVVVSNDLADNPFSDIYELQTDGAWIDGAWRPEARMGLVLMSHAGHTDALRGLNLPRYLREWSFNAFRVGSIWRSPDQPQLQFQILNVRSRVCAEPLPGSDDCADPR